jgi:hypothetical protein
MDITSVCREYQQRVSGEVRDCSLERSLVPQRPCKKMIGKPSTMSISRDFKQMADLYELFMASI